METQSAERFAHLMHAYGTDIKRFCIRYNGILYDITRIDNYEGRKEDLKLYCARRARQNL